MALNDKTPKQLGWVAARMFTLWFLMIFPTIAMTIWGLWERWLGGADGHLQSVWMLTVASMMITLCVYLFLRGAAALCFRRSIRKKDKITKSTRHYEHPDVINRQPAI